MPHRAVLVEFHLHFSIPLQLRDLSSCSRPGPPLAISNEPITEWCWGCVVSPPGCTARSVSLARRKVRSAAIAASMEKSELSVRSDRMTNQQVSRRRGGMPHVDRPLAWRA